MTEWLIATYLIIGLLCFYSLCTTYPILRRSSVSLAGHLLLFVAISLLWWMALIVWLVLKNTEPGPVR